MPLNDGTPPAVDSNQPCNVVGMLKEAACRLRDQTARLFPHLALSDDPLQAMQQAARAIGLRAPTWERRAEQAAKYDLAPEEDLPAVAGEKIGRSFSDMHRALLVSIDEEQRKPLPDAALVGLLCDSVRLLRLHCKGNAS